MNNEINNIEKVAKRLINEEEVILEKDKYLYRIYLSEEGVQYDVFSKDSNKEELEEAEILDGGEFEIEEDLTIELVIEALKFILEEE